MNLVVGFCKLETPFWLNIEPQKCTLKLSVYTAASRDSLKNDLHFELEEKNSVDLQSLACLSDPQSTDNLLFKTGFCCTKGGIK